jgi:hypothetical protein
LDLEKKTTKIFLAMAGCRKPSTTPQPCVISKQKPGSNGNVVGFGGSAAVGGQPGVGLLWF